MRRNFARDENGLVTIEFVVMIPLFLAVLAFSFEFGRVFVVHHGIVNNARSAARYLARASIAGNCVKPAAMSCIDRARMIVRTGKLDGVEADAPAWLPASAVVITPAYSTFTSANFREAGQTLRIDVRATYPLDIFGFAAAGFTGIRLRIVEDERYIGE